MTSGPVFVNIIFLWLFYLPGPLDLILATEVVWHTPTEMTSQKPFNVTLTPLEDNFAEDRWNMTEYGLGDDYLSDNETKERSPGRYPNK